VGSTHGSYQLVDDYSPDNFASKFDFFTENDPTHGYVNYVDRGTAEHLGLFKKENNKIYMAADHTTVASGRGRNSVRITSKNAYTHGLIILDLEHMPDGQCGSWPAFWTFGPNWPNSGEIDIIEGVNRQNTNLMSLHTKSGCIIKDNQDYTGHLWRTNCGRSDNSGCSFGTYDTRTYGDGFNAIGGGVYATEWTSNFISIWFFPRSGIPTDITNGNPNPSTWGKPLAKFSGSNFDAFIRNNKIVFDITFCGDWAGSAWESDKACTARAPSCKEYVRRNPEAFKNAYWLINSLKVYRDSEAPLPGGDPQNNSLIGILCDNGKFVSSENGNSPVICNRDTLQDWEKLRYSKADNKFKLQANTGKYCSSEDGKSPMICNRDAPSEWEEFTWVNNNDGTFSIKCNNGRYLSSEGGNGPMNCNREEAKDWEKFTWVPT